MLDRYEAAQEELAIVSATTTHDATRVGAIRTRLDALASQANLLMMVGVLAPCLRVKGMQRLDQANSRRLRISDAVPSCRHGPRQMLHRTYLR